MIFCRHLPTMLALLLLWEAVVYAAPSDKMAQADALLVSPSLDFQKAKQALFLYEAIPQGDPVLLTKLSRTCFVLGDMALAGERGRYYEKGLGYAEKLVAQQPQGVAGHYWRALNLSGMADVGSRMQGFKLLPKIMEELKRVLVLDESYDAAGVHRVLGRIYFEAPGWPISVGDKKKSLQHLTTAVRLAPQNSTNHLYLAETLMDLGEKNQAKQELEKVLQAKSHPIRPQGVEADRREARRQLEDLKKGK